MPQFLEQHGNQAAFPLLRAVDAAVTGLPLPAGSVTGQAPSYLQLDDEIVQLSSAAFQNRNAGLNTVAAIAAGDTTIAVNADVSWASSTAVPPHTETIVVGGTETMTVTDVIVDPAPGTTLKVTRPAPVAHLDGVTVAFQENATYDLATVGRGQANTTAQPHARGAQTVLLPSVDFMVTRAQANPEPLLQIRQASGTNPHLTAFEEGISLVDLQYAGRRSVVVASPVNGRVYFLLSHVSGLGYWEMYFRRIADTTGAPVGGLVANFTGTGLQLTGTTTYGPKADTTSVTADFGPFTETSLQSITSVQTLTGGLFVFMLNLYV